VEDDPYYFEQFEAYDMKASSKKSSSSSHEQHDAEKYLAGLIPSYLK
jgi:hypothetical protein